MMLEFGDLLSKVRKEKGLTLREVSELVKEEITPSYLSRLEKKEKKNPTFTVVCELMKALDLNVREVFDSFGYGELIRNENEWITLYRHKKIEVKGKSELTGKEKIVFSQLFDALMKFIESPDGPDENVVKMFLCAENLKKEAKSEKCAELLFM